ncbi:MAG: hypothetical protein IKO10_06090 [Lachnospiraceae bacterium]|nr:hypothetical protein [Lachnospiraceae bacterium]
MLNYLQESKATSVVDEATREIDGYVRGVKENPKAEEAYIVKPHAVGGGKCGLFSETLQLNRGMISAAAGC